MNKFFKFSLICLIAFVFSACDSKDDDKTKLTIYTGLEEEYLNSYLEEFKRDFPNVDLNIIRESQGAISAKVMAEKDSPKADALWGMAGVNLIELDKAKLLAPIDFINLENFKSKFIDSANKIPHWLGMDAWTSVLVANKIELDKLNILAPKSYEDLLKPEFKTQIIMPNPASSGTGFLSVFGWISMWGEEKAWDYMDKLNENIKMYIHSGSAPIRLVGQGEAIIGITMDSEALRLAKNFPNNVAIFPSEGYGWDLEGVALINKKEIKPVAKEFIKWALSKKMMEKYSNNIGILALKGVKTKLIGYPKDFEEKLADVDFYKAAKKRSEILKIWEQRYGKGK